MEVLLQIIQFRTVRSKLLFQKVFHGLDIMVSCLLDFFDSVAVLLREVVEDLLEEGFLLVHEVYCFLIIGDNLLSEEAFVPGELHEDSVSNKCKFAEVRSQVSDLF